MQSFLRTYIIPGLIFQSVMIGGGYATGRELVNFFGPAGPMGGVIGLIVAGLIFGVVSACGFEFARITKSYDYRSFSKQLLGPLSSIFEILFLLFLTLVLSVVGSAAGELINDSTGLPAFIGTIVLTVCVGILTFFGSDIISKVLAFWSFALYFLYIALFAITFIKFGTKISESFSGASLAPTSIVAGTTYAGYNLANLPIVLFALRSLTKRTHSIGAGFFAGVIAVLPAIFFFVAMMAFYPSILNEPVPASALMATLEEPFFNVVFLVIVFGTFIETGAGSLHAVNERIAHAYTERNKDMPRWFRPVIAISLLFISVFVATTVGIIDLIAKGYGTLTYGFLLFLVLPIMTLGVLRIVRE
ncbi:MAG: hypothetical protein AAF720_01635 [Pseudomonadota bacterium]